MRHGEAGFASATDKARPLTPAGMQRAGEVGGALVAAGWLPEAIISSDAVRASQTTDQLISGLNSSAQLPTHYEPSFYSQDFSKIVERIDAVCEGQPYQTVIIVGHNPVWSAAVDHFTGSSVSLSPANAALMEVEADSWGEALQLAPSWELVRII